MNGYGNDDDWRPRKPRPAQRILAIVVIVAMAGSALVGTAAILVGM
ncbi:MAG: hypothetical protein PUK40_07155 [Actinomycetaceae bacterium]|nr:hypothetical protein [Arcanobacterium sp.]MDD7505698.1 hypothetical protein [Actinomycetaceae bacterium]MDY6143698.1 hypothetical protein [Arcanobacterium sp.]